MLRTEDVMEFTWTKRSPFQLRPQEICAITTGKSGKMECMVRRLILSIWWGFCLLLMLIRGYCEQSDHSIGALRSFNSWNNNGYITMPLTVSLTPWRLTLSFPTSQWRWADPNKMSAVLCYTRVKQSGQLAGAPSSICPKSLAGISRPQNTSPWPLSSVQFPLLSNKARRNIRISSRTQMAAHNDDSGTQGYIYYFRRVTKYMCDRAADESDRSLCTRSSCE